MEKPTNSLIGKMVLNVKGILIGVIQESIQNGVSGKIQSVLIKPSKEIDAQRYTLTNKGEIIIPYSLLSSVKDVVIIEEPSLY